MIALPEGQGSLWDLDSPLSGKIKSDKSVMDFPFFHVGKTRRTTPIVYNDGNVTIEVRPGPNGIATMYDKEIVLYVGALMVEKLNKGETPDQSFSFSAHDFMRVAGKDRSSKGYKVMLEALDRLQSTTIRTNIQMGGEGEDGFFSWLDNAKLFYSKDEKTGRRRLKGVTVRLCDWLYRGIQRNGRMLTYASGYFDLSPMERRLYEIARSHCGKQSGFVIRLSRLAEKVGTEGELKKFRQEMDRVSREQPLPEYLVSVKADPQRSRALAGMKVLFRPRSLEDGDVTFEEDLGRDTVAADALRPASVSIAPAVQARRPKAPPKPAAVSDRSALFDGALADVLE
jgi:plasmid replication initiation protein